MIRIIRCTALTLDSLGQRAEAITYAEAALPIYEQNESPAKSACKPRKRRGSST
jgi:hypothetical protein